MPRGGDDPLHSLYRYGHARHSFWVKPSGLKRDIAKILHYDSVHATLLKYLGFFLRSVNYGPHAAVPTRRSWER